MKEVMQFLSVLLVISVGLCDVATIPGETIDREMKVETNTVEHNLDKDVCMHNCEMNEVGNNFHKCINNKIFQYNHISKLTEILIVNNVLTYCIVY